MTFTIMLARFELSHAVLASERQIRGKVGQNVPILCFPTRKKECISASYYIVRSQQRIHLTDSFG